MLWPLDVPDHAFPTTYPPTCQSNPFPAKDGLLNFDIPWPREIRRAQAPVQHCTPDISALAHAFSSLSIGNNGGYSACRRLQSSVPNDDSELSIPTMWIPAKSSTLKMDPSHAVARNHGLQRPKPKYSARSSRREANVVQLSPAKDDSPRAQPYPRSKPQAFLPRRIPQSKPQLISYSRSSSRSPLSRSSSTSSLASDDSSSYPSSSDSELGTPPPISANLPLYLSESDLSPSYIPPVSLPKLPKTLSLSSDPLRTFTFRTTIAP